MNNARLFQIVYLLLLHKQMTAPEFARRFEVSVRTIYRDLDTLSASGVPVYASRGKGGGVRLMDGYVLNSAMMNQDEQNQLLMAVKSLSAATNRPTDDLLSKLCALFKQSGTDWLDIDFSPWGRRDSVDRRFETLKTAILQKHVLCFRYMGASGPSERRIKPARLCFKASAWYVQGFCMDRQAYRTFKLNRMTDIHMSDEHFDEALAPPSIETIETDHGTEITLQFSPDVAFRVYDEFDASHIRTLADDSLVVTTYVQGAYDWFYACLLSYDGNVDVLAPTAMKEALALYARQMYQRYQNDLPKEF